MDFIRWEESSQLDCASILALIGSCRAKCEEIHAKFVGGSLVAWLIVENDINDFLYDDVFIQYAACKELLDIVSSIIGNNITATHSMLINKPPGSSSDASRHPMHQDQYYFPFGPPEHVVAAWTALETINEENGCLFVLPGTHTGKLYLHDYPKGFRRAISVHYVDTNCEFFDFKETTRENIAHEIVQMFAKKGVKLSYQDIWKYKGRLIRGPPGNFQKYTSRL
ncbi:phytanoyl-coa alpha-hydroxylase [Holotrichia oblita]|uniref:Phytanoyl-coa alpha-hydroxylase n=1 Tax=Holotrichia oblita TaxID=644536 RepID=A0ACB9TK92_HOLOL|nr:phytanoyl-coa alpha-hydroxylase [Holotrichia oblita]